MKLVYSLASTFLIIPLLSSCVTERKTAPARSQASEVAEESDQASILKCFSADRKFVTAKKLMLSGKIENDAWNVPSPSGPGESRKIYVAALEKAKSATPEELIYFAPNPQEYVTTTFACQNGNKFSILKSKTTSCPDLQIVESSKDNFSLLFRNSKAFAGSTNLNNPMDVSEIQKLVGQNVVVYSRAMKEKVFTKKIEFDEKDFKFLRDGSVHNRLVGYLIDENAPWARSANFAASYALCEQD